MFVRTEQVTVDSINASARMRTHILEDEEKETEVEVVGRWKRRRGGAGGRRGIIGKGVFRAIGSLGVVLGISVKLCHIKLLKKFKSLIE